MHKYDREMLVNTVWFSAKKVGMSPPKIADDIVAVIFPETHSAAASEGVMSILRDGLIRVVKGIIRTKPVEDKQGCFSDIDPFFSPYVSTLKSGAYNVPSIDAYMTVSDLIKDISKLDEARKYMRKKARENAKEADALDALYYAVLAAANDNNPATDKVAA